MACTGVSFGSSSDTDYDYDSDCDYNSDREGISRSKNVDDKIIGDQCAIERFEKSLKTQS